MTATQVTTLERDRAVRTARRLNAATIGWNVAEASVAIGAGISAGSISLLAFGLDSCVEVSAAAVLSWRLFRERRDGCRQPDDRIATRALGVSFLALAGYVAIVAVRALVQGEQPAASAVGIVLAASALVLMPLLARAKRRLAPVLGSRAQAQEARQTQLCAVLAAVVLGGLLVNAALGWWWADPGAALFVAVIAAAEGVRSWRATSLEDTCCA
jgi:divalent metal cation (Fe/Co/Zn/Cd) transporter